MTLQTSRQKLSCRPVYVASQHAEVGLLCHISVRLRDMNAFQIETESVACLCRWLLHAQITRLEDEIHAVCTDLKLQKQRPGMLRTMKLRRLAGGPEKSKLGQRSNSSGRKPAERLCCNPEVLSHPQRPGFLLCCILQTSRQAPSFPEVWEVQ